MARSKGSNNFAGTLEILAAAPLDARSVVPTKADLTASGSFPYPYVGMQVFVTAESKRYTLIGADPTLLANWQEDGQGGGSEGGKMLTGTLLAASWSSNSQTVSVSGLTTSDVGAIGLLNTATSAQIEAAKTAIITPTTIAAGSITFTCENEPSVDIPFGVLVGGGGSGSGASLPSGGTTGQALVKHSNADDDVEWATINGTPSGGTTGQLLAKHSNTDGDVEWKTIAEGQGYTENPVASSNPSYNNESLVSDGQTRFFHTVVGAGESMSSTNLPIVDNTVGRHYYTEMTKASDGLSFTQRLRVFYTKNSVECVSLFERRCYSDGTTWTYVDWVETTVDGIPTGGTTGQALVKNSNTDKDVTWGSMPDAYTPDDTAFTDIADGDYIPVYDTSASTKKKSLWSNIVDVLKNTFQQKLTAGNNIGINNNVITATNAISLKFSTTEQEVGTWIDGSKVYQKTIAITLPSTSADGTVANNLYSIGSNVKYLVYMWGSFTTSANNGVPIEHFVSITTASSIPRLVGSYSGVRLNNYSTSSEKNKLSVSNSNSSWNGCQGYVTLIYTKA